MKKRWSEKIVVVTGGSKGLGFQIAFAFAKRGGEVVLLARTQNELEAAKKQLTSLGLKAHVKVMNVLDDSNVETVFTEISEQFGRIDVLVNSIGKSTRMDLRNLDLQESRNLMEINFFSALKCTRLALNQLIENQGHVVNIGSLACKTAWPLMTPYSASKFALAALTHQLRIELQGKVHAMLVCPGPIQRIDAGHRYNNLTENLPEQAKSPGAGAKIKGIDAGKLAEQIVDGCEKRKAELIVPWKAKILFIAASISTRIGDWLLRINNKVKS